MRIRILPLGFAYILLSGVISAAAANTGNNAMYMIAALMLGLFILSGVLSILSLNRLEVGRLSGGEILARKPASVYVEIRNHGWWPLAGISINEKPCPSVPGRGSRLARLTLEFQRRGLQTPPPLWVQSHFPFGFLARRKVAGAPSRLLVFPALGAPGLASRSMPQDLGQEERSSRWGEVLEHRGLKPFSAGDDPRHVHWKKSAQRGHLVAIEYDHRAQGARELFLDTRSEDPARFEQEVERVASACDQLLRRGIPVALATPRFRFAAGTGEGHRRRLLGFLALVEREA